MNNLYKKLNTEAGHLKLTQGEKSAMHAAIFGAPSSVVVTRSSFVFLSQRWMTALAALVVVVFAGGSTAYAAQGALPGQPLYALKTQVLEPVKLALAAGPAAKAAVHVEIAQARVAEAENLAQQGTLTATTSTELADNFESHAQSALALADEVSGDDPAAAVQIKAQLSANATVGSAVLAALGRGRGGGNKEHADAIAMRVLARASNSGEGSARASVAFATAPKAAARAMAVSTFAATSTEGAGQDSEASVNPEYQNVAAQLQVKAQTALNAARALAAATSTLDASTTVSVETSLAGISALMQAGSQALSDSLFDTAVKDFTEALGRSLRLEALLKAQQTFDSHTFDSLFKSDGSSGDSGHSDGSGSDDLHL
jgi:hypothetical protein